MYEDDGKTYDYENGAIATTRFECKQSERIVEFTVFPVEGSYNGMCKARTYELEIDAPQRPSEVLVNNVPIMDCISFWNGMIAPSRTNSNPARLSGIACLISLPPANFSPVQKSNQFPFGK